MARRGPPAEPSSRIPDARKTPIFPDCPRVCLRSVPNGTPMTKWEAEKRFRGWMFANCESRCVGFAKFKTETTSWNKPYPKSQTVCHTIRSRVPEMTILSLSRARGCRALEANSRLALEARRGSLACRRVSHGAQSEGEMRSRLWAFSFARRRVGTSRARASKRFARTPRCARLWRARRATSRRRARSRRAWHGAACPGSGPRRARRSARRARHPPLPSVRDGRRCT